MIVEVGHSAVAYVTPLSGSPVGQADHRAREQKYHKTINRGEWLLSQRKQKQ